MLQFKRRQLLGIGLLTISFYVVCSLSLFHDAYADDKSIKMTEQRNFRDSNGNLNVVGVVDNNGKVPVGITVAMNTTGKDTAPGRQAQQQQQQQQQQQLPLNNQLMPGLFIHLQVPLLSS